MPKINEFTKEEVLARKAEIKEILEKETEVNLDQMENEIKELDARMAQLESEERRQQMLSDVANGAGVVIPTVNTKNVTASTEYRSAFMAYVQRGEVSNVLQRANKTGVSTDLGVLIPETVIQKVIKDLDGVYGQLYSRVRKTNIPGGVKYPIGNFDATFKRITENTVSDRQKGGSITAFVQFSYNIGEIRIAQTLLQAVLAVDAFENELASVIVKAYIKAMDHEILLGEAAKNECEGILTEANKKSGSRIKAAQIIEFTEAEVTDWKKWQKKLFATLPIAMRSQPYEFVMTAGTYEGIIKTLADNNNRPVYAETFNPMDGSEVARFKGKQVTFVEEDGFKDFETAATGDYFGMLWVPMEAYAINSNQEFGYTRYFDHETNQWVDKALVINDGKILNPAYIYLLKKKVG